MDARRTEDARAGTPANATQVGGDHYKTGGEEHWDRSWRLDWDPFQYQITKYVERWKKKNGIQDLRKALHFLQKYIELAERDGIKGLLEMEREAELAELHGNIRRLEEARAMAARVEACAQIMQHRGDALYTFEGIKENRVYYRCRQCREHLTLELHQMPQDVHTSCPARGYVQQDPEESGIGAGPTPLVLPAQD